MTHDNGDKPLSDGISTTCPHCGEDIEGSDLELNTDPPDGVVRWFPSLLSREEWAKQKGGGAKP